MRRPPCLASSAKAPCFQAPSTLWPGSPLHPLLWPRDIPLRGQMVFCSFLCRGVDTGAVSVLWLLGKICRGLRVFCGLARVWCSVRWKQASSWGSLRQLRSSRRDPCQESPGRPPAGAPRRTLGPRLAGNQVCVSKVRVTNSSRRRGRPGYAATCMPSSHIEDLGTSLLTISSRLE